METYAGPVNGNVRALLTLLHGPNSLTKPKRPKSAALHNNKIIVESRM